VSVPLPLTAPPVIWNVPMDCDRAPMFSVPPAIV